MPAPSSHLVVVSAVLALAACAGRDVPPPSHRIAIVALPSPTSAGAAEPFLSTSRDGKLALSWLTRQADSTTSLQVATSGRDGTWSTPSTIVRTSDLFVNWADFPSVVSLADGQLLAHWLQRNGKGKFAYDVRLAASADGGRTWSDPVSPHQAGLAAEHGFVTLLPRPDSGADIFFLHGDTVRTAPADAHMEHRGPPMRLGVARWAVGGTIADAAIIDSRICDCCQTAAARTTSGPVVLFRDRSETETRDIGVLRHVGGQWTAPRLLHADGWTIDACPVNGPAISADGDRLAAVWFTAARDTAKVQLVFSTDAGVTFGPPVRIDGGQPVGRVDVELLGGGDALVTWIERRTADSADVRARIVRADGSAEPPVTISAASAARASGFPRMARTAPDAVTLAWTVAGTASTPSTVRLARLQIAPR